MEINETNRKEHVYPIYGRQFISYRWFKPILVGILWFVFYILFSVVTIIAAGVTSPDPMALFDSFGGGYDTLDTTSVAGIIANLGGVAIMIPALALAGLIVRDRPFSSYSSSRGGWNWGTFFKCLLIGILTVSVPMAAWVLIEGGTVDMKMTGAAFIALTILGPLQCIAEEYIFRGLLMQTLGSWFRLPVIAVILQAAVFAMLHPYNMLGVAAIVVSGLTFGLAAWLGRGIEVSSALHIANNMMAFYLVGRGMTSISSESTVQGLIFDIVVDVLYLVIVLAIGNKRGWFDKIRKDDKGKWNAKIEAKRAAKLAKHAAK